MTAERKVRGKYETRLDPALWAYVDAVDAWYPPEITALPIDRQREVYDSMCRAFHQGRPRGVKASGGLIVAPDHGIKPHTAVIAHHYIPHHRAIGCEVNIFS